MHDELVDHSADEDSDEFVRRTITWDNEFSFQVDMDETVLREDKMTDILDAVDEKNEMDTPLKFRRFVGELLAKMRIKLLGAINDDDIFLQDVPCSIPRGELLDEYLFDDVFFRVKKPRCKGSKPSDSVEF